LGSVQEPEAWLRQAAATATFDTSARLGAIAAPTLVLHGDQDHVVPVDNARLLAGRLPRAELRVIPGGGHLAFVEQADAFNEAVLEFLGQIDAASGEWTMDHRP
jgi:pimeloyl-ACP methyl ester carboxylesterase